MPSSRYFAVAGPKLRCAQVLGRRQHRRRVGHVHPGAGPHQHGLDVLRAQHRAEPAAPGVAAVVADRRVADAAVPRPARSLRCASRARTARARPPRPPPRPARPARGPVPTARPSPSTSSTESTSARPRTTIASLPVSLPEMANWLDASASVSSPVNGDLATTANFALVVSGVPTSGENTNASGAAGAERVDPRRGEPVQQPGAQPDAAQVGAQHRRRRVAAARSWRRSRRRRRPGPARSSHQATRPRL